jgi:hypothetical protein
MRFPRRDILECADLDNRSQLAKASTTSSKKPIGPERQRARLAAVKLVVNEAALQERGRAHSGSDPPGETSLDRWLDEPFPNYDTEPVVAFSAS